MVRAGFSDASMELRIDSWLESLTRSGEKYIRQTWEQAFRNSLSLKFKFAAENKMNK